MEMSDHPKSCEHLLRTVSILQQLQKALGGLKGLHAFRAERCLRIGKMFVGRLRWPKLRPQLEGASLLIMMSFTS